jgi:Lysyl oxidase
MDDRGAKRGRALLVVLLGSLGLASVGSGLASAATGYKLAFGSRVDAAATGGPLIIRGHRAAIGDPMMADQIVKHTDGSTTTRANMGQLIYEEYPGSVSHRHWHYKGFVRYQLRSVSDMSLVRPDNKAGFCLSDPVYALDFCGSQKPDALEVSEGIGPGTTDYYNPNLEGQWIDVQDVPPGDYWLLHWVNSTKEICESDYSNNAAAVKIALWPNGYGVAPYFALKDTAEPFPSLYPDPSPPFDCDSGSIPAPKFPDLVQRAPSELSVTPVPDPTVPGSGQPGGGSPENPQGGGSPGGTTTAPTLTKSFARRYAVLALAQRFRRRPTNVSATCWRLSRTSFRCAARWRFGRYAFRGKVRIFTARKEARFERRFSLRVRRTDTVCESRHRPRCSRTVRATNVRFRRGLADVASRR